MPNFTLFKNKTALLIVDMQERVLAAMDRGPEVLQTILKVVQGFQALKIPIYLSEQYPQGLGSTVEPLKQQLGDAYQPWIKSTFSCMDDYSLSHHLMSLPIQQWVIIGIEAHVCVLQTAKGLLNAGSQVTVLNDAITSRSIYNYSTAIAEMRDAGARISCMETVFFELLRDSKAPEFKQISQLIKSPRNCCCC